MKNILWLGMAASLLLANQAETRDLEHIIRCESNGFAPKQCQFPPTPPSARIAEVQVVRQYSTKPCIEGKSWEAGYGGMIVTNGCRADFRIVYRLSDYDNRGEGHDRRRHDYQAPRYEEKESWRHGSFGQDEPTDIVMRAFAEILDRRPTRQELRDYRSLITRHNWSERQLRRELRRQYSE